MKTNTLHWSHPHFAMGATEAVNLVVATETDRL
eukprot:SAG11_NODE_38024_length_254_cov_0.670968_1_plen_32_part_10